MDRRYDVNRYLRKDFSVPARKSSGMLDGDMTEKAVAVGVGLLAGGVLMHFAHKNRWFGMGAPASPAPAPAPAQLPAASAPPAVGAATAPAAGVRVVNIG